MKINLLKSSFLLLCLLMVNVAFAQNIRVTGTVTDSQGEPIIGASVMILGTTQGVPTDAIGKYEINAPANATLEFSYIGFTTQEIPVNNRTQINVQLASDAVAMEELVVVGYGTMRKVDLTGSVGSIQVDETMSNRALSNMASGLSGLIPGLQVSTTTAMAGSEDAVNLRIRGIGTVNNAAPLVVVDGMPDVPLARINLNDVESISVLKDAASAAIYGSRSANGVILVTTKSGKNMKGKTRVEFTAQWTLSKPKTDVQLIDDYPRTMSLMQQQQFRGTLPASLTFKNSTIDQWLALQMLDPLKFPKTNWFDIIMRDGTMQSYNVSATGGTDKYNFYLSIGTVDEKGMQINNDYKRHSARLSFESELRHNIRAGVRWDGNWSYRNYSGMAHGFSNNDTGDSGGGDMQYAIPGITPYDPVTDKFGGVMGYGDDVSAMNPYAIFANRDRRQDRQQMNGAMHIQWEPVKGLSLRTEYRLRYTDAFNKTSDWPTGGAYNFQTGYENMTRQYVGNTTGVSDSQTTYYRTNWLTQANYNITFAQHHRIDAMFGYEEEFVKERSMSASRNQRIHPSVSEIDACLRDVQSAGGSSWSEGMRSYIARVNYSGMNGRYLLTLQLRADGSSRFLDGHRWGVFPAISAGWRFSEEDFVKSWAAGWLSNGKLRASYGETGNREGVNRFEQQPTLSQANYVQGSSPVTGLINKKMVNQDLTWEESRTIDVGLELGFLNNRLNTEFMYYNRKTSGMLRPSEMSLHLTGLYNAPRRNIGDMRNQGVEFVVSWRDRIGDFGYGVSVNGAWVFEMGRILSWNEHLSRGNRFVGMSDRFLYYYKDIGLAQTFQDGYNNPQNMRNPGEVIRLDLNGDGRVDGMDRKAVPSMNRENPVFTFGGTLNADWKGIDFVLTLNGALGRKDYWNSDWNKNSFGTRSTVTKESYDNFWSLERRNAKYPHLGGGGDKYESSMFLQNLSYLRIKNLQVGYTLPERWLSVIGLKAVRVFVSTENLATITSFEGLDPEKPNSGRDLFPINKSYSLGLTISF